MSIEFTNAQSLTLEQANVGTSVISILGSGFIIFCYFYLKELRTFAFKLVLFVSISDVGYSIGNFLGDAGGSDTHLGSSEGLCQFQAVVVSYFGLTSLFWAVSIAFTLHKAFLQESEAFGPTQIHEHAMKYHAICWLVPALLTVLPLVNNGYGDTGGWCWIPEEKIYWRFIQFYILLWLGVGYNCYVFINIYQKIKAMAGQVNTGNATAMANRLRLYPFVLVICHFFGMIESFYEAFSGGKMIYELNLLAVIFGTSMGLFNAVIYGLTPEVTKQLCRSGSNQDMHSLDNEI